MRFRQDVLQQFGEQVVQLGLDSCPVCSSEMVEILRYPTYVHLGGFSREKDGDAQMLYAVTLRCEVCGHMMFFDIEKFHSGDDPILIAHGHDDPSA